jgi:hypothetical protein
MEPTTQEQLIFWLKVPVEFQNTGICQPKHPVMLGGIIVEQEGLWRLFIKVNYTGVDKSLMIENGQHLGTVTIWSPPVQRHTDEWWRDRLDVEMMAQNRKLASKAIYTSDEETVQGWRNMNPPQEKGISEEEDDRKKPAVPMYRDNNCCRYYSGTDSISRNDSDKENINPQNPINGIPQTLRIDPIKEEGTRESSSLRSPLGELEMELAGETEDSSVSDDNQSIGSSKNEDPTFMEKLPEEESTEEEVQNSRGRSSQEDESSYSEDEQDSEVEINVSTRVEQISMKRIVRRKPKHDKKKQRAFFGMVKSLKLTKFKEKTPRIATTEMLPHALFPIGHKRPGQSMKTCPTIRALIDTGSGLNIGYEPYWKSVYEEYPELVREYGELSEEEHNKLTIGGIDREGEGTTCSHYIVLKTPFMDRGNEVDLRIALTEGLSCNLIFGLPFIVRAKMIINTYEKYMVSLVFQTTFPLHYHPPELRTSVVPQEGMPLALAARSAS